MTTTRMGGNLDLTTYVVADAMATFARRAPDGARIDAENDTSHGAREHHG
jgi:hypothetical protein